MQMIKFFKGVENELVALETEINAWIQSSGARVVSVTGNIAPQSGSSQLEAFSSSDVLVIIVYESPRA